MKLSADDVLSVVGCAWIGATLEYCTAQKMKKVKKILQRLESTAKEARRLQAPILVLRSKRALQVPKTGPGSSKRMVEVLKAVGISQAEMSRQIGVGSQYTNDVVRGRRSLGDKLAARLQAKYGVSPAWLRYGEGKMFLSKGSPRVRGSR